MLGTQIPGPLGDPGYDLESDLDQDLTLERYALWTARQDTMMITHEHVYSLWFVSTFVLTFCFISGEYVSADNTLSQGMTAKLLSMVKQNEKWFNIKAWTRQNFFCVLVLLDFVLNHHK